MNPRFDLHVLAWLLVIVGAFFAVPLLVALLLGEPMGPFLVSGVAAIGVGLGVARVTRTVDRRLRPRDGFVIVGAAWLVTSSVGALPYLAGGALGPVDALFESVSGFTTTGSTVVNDTASLDRSLLLWRALTQWIGGMGIILFTIAILPLLGIGGMRLFRAEVPGPVADKVRPRLVETARILWAIYLGLSAAEVVALSLCGMSLFDAVCHTFTTVATGGFSTRNGSVGEFDSAAIEWVVTAFMLFAGMNFVLHFRVFTGRVREVLRDVELRYFAAVVVVATVIVTLTRWGPGSAFGADLRSAAFHVVSIVTTTGFVADDFELWPALAQLVLLALMVLGGMSGSTGGGVKSLRIVLAVRSLRATVHRLLHPHAVVPVKYGGAVVAEGLLAEVWGFLLAYAAAAAVGSAVVAAHGYDILTATSAALTALGNVGPGIGEVGAYDNFAHLPALVKLTLSGLMLLGRLEIFTLLVLFSRRFWQR